MVCVDIYVNETTRHADVILPAPEPLAKAHYDFALYQLAVRSVANYSPPVLPRADDQPDEWEVVLRLAAIAAGQGPEADLEAWDDLVVQTLVGRETALPGSRVEGRTAEELVAELGERRGPERVLDFMLRVGPFGDGFGADPDGLTLDKLRGESARRSTSVRCGRGCRRRCGRPSGKIELAPAEIVADVPRLRGGARGAGGQRPHGPDRAPPAALEQLLDAQPAGPGQGQGPLHDADPSRRRRAARPRRRRARAPGQLERRRAGRAGRDHRRDHARRGLDPARLGPRRAGRPARGRRAHAGVNSNLLSPVDVDVPSGNAVLNGIPVEVSAAEREPAGLGIGAATLRHGQGLRLASTITCAPGSAARRCSSSAPRRSTADGHVNVSPKGPIGSLRVLDERTVAYLDIVGSGAETIAHLRENGRIVVMLCAFEGPPRILRLHGRGEVADAGRRARSPSCSSAATSPSPPRPRRGARSSSSRSSGSPTRAATACR